LIFIKLELHVALQKYSEPLPLLQVLNNLVSEHVISEEQAHTAKVQYEELHQAVLAAMAAESARLTEGEVLQKQLAAQVAQAAEKQGSPETLNSQVFATPCQNR
jgi:multidrug resistance efflux pump